jgi:hypothetical protein
MPLYNEYTLECPSGQTYTNPYDIREAAADTLGSTIKNRIIAVITSEGVGPQIEEEVIIMLSTSKFHCERTFKAGTPDSLIAEMEGYLEQLNDLGWIYVKLV